MKKASLALQVSIGLVIGILAMFWALQGTDLDQIGLEFQKAKWFWLLPTAAIFLIQQLIRAYRQQLIIQATHPEHRFGSSLSILCIGFFFINTLPARMGEFARPLLLQAKENIPIGSGLAMVFTERIIDLIAAFIMFILVLGFAKIRIIDAAWLDQGQEIAAYALPVLILILCIALFYSQVLLPFFAFAPKIQQALLHFGQSMNALRKGGRFIHILWLTFLTWGLTGWMYVTAAMSFQIETLIGYMEGLGLLAFTMLGMAVPNAPGFAGAYEASFVAGLEVFGVTSPQLAFAMAFGFHWWIFFVQACTAIYFLATDRINIRNLLSQIHQQRRSSNA